MSTFYNDFGEMLPHTVLVSRKIAVDSYGTATYDTAETYQARVTFGTKIVRNRFGELVPSSGTVWMFTREKMNVEDKYQFLSDAEPSPAEYTQLYPLRLDAIADENGFYYNKIYFE